jgi:small subunit ribosomal protein S17
MAEDETNVNDEQAEATPDEAAAQATPEETAATEAPEAAPAAVGEDAAPQEALSPKQRRKRDRSTHRGTANAPRTLEERVAERAQARARKAAHRRAYRAKQRERRQAQPSSPPPAPEPKGTGRLKTRQGVVVSDKADKTITVRIDVARRHRVYKKIVRTSTTLHAHDESNEASIGDTVRVIESRPLSRTKRWRLVEVLERAR